MDTTAKTPKTPHLDALDREIAEWKTTLDIATSNLLALTELPIYARLSGRDGSGGAVEVELQGESKSRVGPALNAVHELFEGFARLKNVIGRAEEARRALNWPWMFEAKLEELDRLLHGDSVELATVETPLEKRGLLSQARAQHHAKPKELLQAMTRAFEDARDTLVSVGETWEELPLQADDARRELDALRELPLGTSGERELGRVEERLNALLPQLGRDPLGARNALDNEVWPSLRAFRERLALMQRDDAVWRGEMSEAHTVLAQLQSVTARARALADEVRQKIENAAPRDPAPDAVAADFAAWLETLQNTARDNRLPAARIGLSRWREAAQSALHEAEAARDFNRAPLDQLVELRGRLDALDAKARALNARGELADVTLLTTSREADALLSRRPTPIAQAAALVSALEKGLSRA